MQIAFSKQFHDSVGKSDYEALRSAFVLVRYAPITFFSRAFLCTAIEGLKLIGCFLPFFHLIQIHYPSHPNFDFHKYLTRALEHDFKRVVGIRLVFL